MTRHTDVRSAYLVTLAAAILAVVGLSVDVVFWHVQLHAIPPWHFVALAVSAGIGVFLLTYRGTRDPRIPAALFVVNNCSIVAALWIADTGVAHRAAGWVPFQSEKLGALTVAVLAPPSAWAGGLSIALFIGSSLAHFELFERALSARWTAEPWATMIYGVFATLLYAYRLHARSTESRMAESLAAKRTVEDISRMLLALRDFSNTPLQTMFLTTALLRARHEHDGELLQRMERSLARLRELNEIMSRYETQISWGPSDESFDAAEILQKWLHGGSPMITATPAARAWTPFFRSRSH